MVKFKGRDSKGCLLFWRGWWDEIMKSKLEHVNMVVYMIYMCPDIPMIFFFDLHLQKTLRSPDR